MYQLPVSLLTMELLSSRNIEQKILTVSWGDGTTSQSKITRIPSSSEGKWGPLYHKYDSATSSNPYAIVAILDVLSSSSSKGIVQIKSEPVHYQCPERSNNRILIGFTKK